MLYQGKSDRVIRPSDLGLLSQESMSGISALGVGSSQLPRVLTLELCRERQFTTTGGGGSVWTTHVLVSDLAGVGPAIEDIVVHIYGRGFSTNFTYRIIAQKSYDGVDWSAFASALVASTTASGNTISSAYSTRTDFGLHIRFIVEVTDVGAKEIGCLSISLAIRLAR